MSRLIGIVVIIALIWLVFVRMRKANSQKTNQPPSGSSNDKMVRCAQCGVYLPQQQAITKADKHYCCNDHLPR